MTVYYIKAYIMTSLARSESTTKILEQSTVKQEQNNHFEFWSMDTI